MGALGQINCCCLWRSNCTGVDVKRRPSQARAGQIDKQFNDSADNPLDRLGQVSWWTSDTAGGWHRCIDHVWWCWIGPNKSVVPRQNLPDRKAKKRTTKVELEIYSWRQCYGRADLENLLNTMNPKCSSKLGEQQSCVKWHSLLTASKNSLKVILVGRSR